MHDALDAEWLTSIRSLFTTRQHGWSRMLPLGPEEWRCFRDGQQSLMDIDRFRKRVFRGGVGMRCGGASIARRLTPARYREAPALRAEVWPYLLLMYPPGATAAMCRDLYAAQSREFERLKQTWTERMLASDPSALRIHQEIWQDVLRTDWYAAVVRLGLR